MPYVKPRACSNGDFGVINASSNCSGEQTHVSIRHMHELAQMESCVPEAKALVSLHIFRGSSGLRNSIRIPSHVHARFAVCVPFMPAVKALMNLDKVAQVHLSLLSIDNLISNKLSC